MIYKPSAIEEYLSTLPKPLQVIGLQAIKEEHERWESDDLTKQEREFQKIVYNLAMSACRYRENIIKGYFT